MGTRNQQDSFMDDTDDSCPLCVEEFDLSDKNFRPCPCGYQVCQFCYNNIKNNMNGLCPACRRPYDEQSIEWKIVSPEEQKADVALQARKKAAARKKETEQRQVETLNRKHLAGLRVVQKNLVYVVGLSQKSSEEEFLQTLRGDQYFGQYGKIIKIVVSKAKEGSNNTNSIGVYVTFEKKDDAAKCIAAVDGSRNLDRPLRAQYGTTKYCSSYLRNEQCTNRQCTFLHETGEDYDSFSRQDLSSMNAMSTQRPAQSAASSSRANQPPPQPQPPPQQAPQSISAAPQTVRDEAMSRSDSGDGSALPSSASWAAKNAPIESRRSSKPASVAASSPATTNASLVAQPVEARKVSAESESKAADPLSSHEPYVRPPRQPSPFLLERAMKKVANPESWKWTLDRTMYTKDELKWIDNCPPLFAPDGGLKQYRIAKEQEQQRIKQAEERNVIGAISAAEEDENPASGGSLQLGGEPETQDDVADNVGRMNLQQRGAIQPPYSATSSTFGFGGSVFQPSNAQNLPRTLTPQQQRQLSLLQSGTRQSPVSHGQFQHGYGQNTSLHQQQLSNPFQMQMQNQAFGSAQGHGRQASRYTFANGSSSASTAVKPAANPQLMAQQSAMMPTKQSQQYQNQPYQQQSNTQTNFYSGVQGPPPGLKSSGTPPVSGGGMFVQGHNFTTPMNSNSNFNVGGNKNTNEDLMRGLLRTGRTGSVSGLGGSDIGKREFNFPTAPQSLTSDASASSLLGSLHGQQLGSQFGYQDHSLSKQKKKGKKHRHANTSSFGGGGLVDLADPSILQARMHHAGQGQYGAQGQDIPTGPRFLAAVSKIDNPMKIDVVNSAPSQAASGKPTLRPISNPTPAPPGLSSSQDFPSLPAPSALPSAPVKPQRKVAAKSIKPVIPVLPTTSTSIEVSGAETRADDQSLQPIDIVLDQITEDEPLKDNIVTATPETKRVEQKALDTSTLESEKAAPTTSRADNRQRPSKLDIKAAKEAPKELRAAKTTNQPKKTDDKSDVASKTAPLQSQPAAPATAAPQTPSSPAAAEQSKARVLATPKKDPSRSSTTISPSVHLPISASKQVSRRPSVTSIQQPGTPASELISDNASLTSTSFSRANSPPPSRIGTAPVRHVTKSQLKKDRQTRAKQELSKTTEQPMAKAEEPVQAPILGRKKKTKKTKTKESTADSTPTVTRPPSPEPKEEPFVAEKKMPTPTPSPAKNNNRKSNAKATQESKSQETPPQEQPNNPTTSPATATTEDATKDPLSISSLFASLIASGDLDPSVSTDLFKPAQGLNTRYDNTLDIAKTPIPVLKEDQTRHLDAGKMLCLEYGENKTLHLVVFPDRRCLRGLTKQQAMRYMNIYERNGGMRPLATFDDVLPKLDSDLDAAAAAAAADDADADDEGDEDKELVNRFAGPAALSSGLGATSSAGRSLRDGSGESGAGSRLGIGSVDAAETACAASRRETEAIEKKLNALLKKNRRLMG